VTLGMGSGRVVWRVHPHIVVFIKFFGSPYYFQRSAAINFFVRRYEL